MSRKGVKGRSVKKRQIRKTRRKNSSKYLRKGRHVRGNKKKTIRGRRSKIYGGQPPPFFGQTGSTDDVMEELEAMNADLNKGPEGRANDVSKASAKAEATRKALKDTLIGDDGDENAPQELNEHIDRIVRWIAAHERGKPVWEISGLQEHCMDCTKDLKRGSRHHCRYCGQLVCDSCSAKRDFVTQAAQQPPAAARKGEPWALAKLTDTGLVLSRQEALAKGTWRSCNRCWHTLSVNKYLGSSDVIGLVSTLDEFRDKKSEYLIELAKKGRTIVDQSKMIAELNKNRDTTVEELNRKVASVEKDVSAYQQLVPLWQGEQAQLSRTIGEDNKGLTWFLNQMDINTNIRYITYVANKYAESWWGGGDNPCGPTGKGCANHVYGAFIHRFKERGGKLMDHIAGGALSFQGNTPDSTGLGPVEELAKMEANEWYKSTSKYVRETMYGYHPNIVSDGDTECIRGCQGQQDCVAKCGEVKWLMGELAKLVFGSKQDQDELLTAAGMAAGHAGAAAQRLEEEVESKAESKAKANEVAHAAARKYPKWIPDEDVTACMICDREFDNLVFGSVGGKHHCRYCGWVVCNDHSKNRLVLSANNILNKPDDVRDSPGEAQRVCDFCFKYAPQEMAEQQRLDKKNKADTLARQGRQRQDMTDGITARLLAAQLRGKERPATIAQETGVQSFEA